MPKAQHIEDLTKAITNTATHYKPLDSWKQPQSANEIKIENPALHTTLMEWRTQTAEIKKLMGYHVVSDQAIADISAKLPRTLTQLAKIKNMGEGKASEYGEQLLKLIRKHLGENELFF